MAQFPPALVDREQNKFEQDPVDAGTDVRVLVKNDSPIPVSIEPSSGVQKNIYAEALSVPSGSETQILSYSVPLDKVFILRRIEASGNNIATFRVKIDAVVIAKVYTYFSGPLSYVFDFSEFELNAGAILSVTAEHARPDAGDFSARVEGIES